jgi:hypothetical protein
MEAICQYNQIALWAALCVESLTCTGLVVGVCCTVKAIRTFRSEEKIKSILRVKPNKLLQFFFLENRKNMSFIFIWTRCLILWFNDVYMNYDILIFMIKKNSLNFRFRHILLSFIFNMPSTYLLWKFNWIIVVVLIGIDQ